jgi:hypothetical protein
LFAAAMIGTTEDMIQIYRREDTDLPQYIKIIRNDSKGKRKV